MSFDMWGYRFDGAYPDPNLLKSSPGIYVIWSKKGENWKVLDVGESADVKDRLLDHERKPCWTSHCTGELVYSATYTPDLDQPGREKIAQHIRGRSKPPCGDIVIPV